MANNSKTLTETHAKWMIRKTGAREKLSAFEFNVFCNLIEKLKKEDQSDAKK